MEKNSLHWIYSKATSLEGKLKHFNAAILPATRTKTVSNNGSLSLAMIGQNKILGQRPNFFKSLSKYSDITTHVLSWYPSAARNKTRIRAEIRETINSLLHVKVYYRCAIDERFHETLQYPANNSITQRNLRH